MSPGVNGDLNRLEGEIISDLHGSLTTGIPPNQN